jgi:uncharacterized integral membrane protein
MVSAWTLLACIVGAFSFGVLIMAIVQYSRMRDLAERSQVRKLKGLHPLEATTQM